MKLIDILKLIQDDFYPPIMEEDKNGRFSIDTRPESLFNITICFMCEEETWITCNIQNEILIPWYKCEVSSIQPSDEQNSICIWLKDEEYIRENFSDCVEIRKVGEAE